MFDIEKIRKRFLKRSTTQSTEARHSKTTPPQSRCTAGLPFFAQGRSPVRKRHRDCRKNWDPWTKGPVCTPYTCKTVVQIAAPEALTNWEYLRFCGSFLVFAFHVVLSVSGYSIELEDICAAMLVKDPAARPSLSDILTDHELLRATCINRYQPFIVCMTCTLRILKC